MRTIAPYVASVLLSLNFVLPSFPSLADAPKADNTAQNRGATRQDATTAEKQKNDKSDVSVLAELRKSIMAQQDLSMDAKNVKILYSKGRVTLRGPVDSADEKTKVEELAKGCGGVTSVKSMLSISPKAH